MHTDHHWSQHSESCLDPHRILKCFLWTERLNSFLFQKRWQMSLWQLLLNQLEPHILKEFCGFNYILMHIRGSPLYSLSSRFELFYSRFLCHKFSLSCWGWASVNSCSKLLSICASDFWRATLPFSSSEYVYSYFVRISTKYESYFISMLEPCYDVHFASDFHLEAALGFTTVLRTE